MNCKNCESEMLPDYKFCNQCGAKVVAERITVKHLLYSLLISFGWDSQFFVTLRDMFMRPQLVFERYLSGTRKKYTNPFTFFAIGTALSVFVLSFYSDQLIEISTKASVNTSESIINSYSHDDAPPQLKEEQAAIIKKQEDFNRKMVSFMFKYYNYLSFLFLPFYTLIALLVYGRQNTFGEHLVINAYIHGLIAFYGLILFFVTLWLKTDVYSGGAILLTFIAYLYAYKKYKKHSVGKTIKVLFKFVGIMLLIVVVLSLVGFIVGRFFMK